MTTIGKNTAVTGEVRSTEDLTIEGRIDGPVLCESSAVVVTASAHVTGDIIARDITVFGRTTGQLVATDTVDLRSDAVVRGTVVSARFILNPEARFDGRVEPQHLEAALRVARYEQKKRDAVGVR
ncbi:MAG: polymer-forming cytoskeletal protein [Acidobacteriota bacterium]